jgi:hypothetical protein
MQFVVAITRVCTTRGLIANYKSEGIARRNLEDSGQERK